MMERKQTMKNSQLNTHLIEKEYINSMLDLVSSDVIEEETEQDMSVSSAQAAPAQEKVQEEPELEQAEQAEQENPIQTDEVHVEEIHVEPVQSAPVSSKAIFESADIECKVFSIAGLKLAFPLASIRDLKEQQKILSVTKKSKTAGICLGGIKHENRFIKIADLSYFIMAGKNAADKIYRYENNQVNVLFLNGLKIGVVYDEVIDTQVILHDDVCWRDPSSDRTWLAGTVKQYGFSLLDSEGIINLLNTEC